MAWNWQLPDWPEFRWERLKVEQMEHDFLKSAGVILGARRHFDHAESEDLLLQAMTDDAFSTSAIEGEMLERSSIQASLRRELGLAVASERSSKREDAIAMITVDGYRNFSKPLTDTMLFAWHRTLMAENDRLEVIGGYRRHGETMQIVSGQGLRPKVHFEAPPSSVVPTEMHKFIEWFNLTAPAGNGALSAIARAAVAHVYFESIHPFEDGNGRIGRVLSEKILAQAVGEPMITLLSTTLLRHRKAYYAALAAASTTTELTAWIMWFADIVLEAQRDTLTRIDFVKAKTTFIDNFGARLNDRQLKAVLRVLHEGPDGFVGGLSARKYISITGASTASATRDLTALVQIGAFHQSGDFRHRRYFLNLPEKSA